MEKDEVKPSMVCRGIFTPMTHRFMASVVLIPPTSSISFRFNNFVT